MTTGLDYAPPMNDTGWITRAEAAERIGVSLQTIDRYVSKGVINSRKNSFTARVTLSAKDVEAVRRERATP